MIVSNEPGYYEEGKFGVSENLIYVKKVKNKLKFENLTMAPLDNDLINKKLLNSKELEYLLSYNMEIYNNLSKYLNKKERVWLINSSQ